VLGVERDGDGPAGTYRVLVRVTTRRARGSSARAGRSGPAGRGQPAGASGGPGRGAVRKVLSGGARLVPRAPSRPADSRAARRRRRIGPGVRPAGSERERRDLHPPLISSPSTSRPQATARGSRGPCSRRSAGASPDTAAGRRRALPDRGRPRLGLARDEQRRRHGPMQFMPGTWRASRSTRTATGWRARGPGRRDPRCGPLPLLAGGGRSGPARQALTGYSGATRPTPTARSPRRLSTVGLARSPSPLRSTLLASRTKPPKKSFD